MTRVLVIGGNGMLGSAVGRMLSEHESYAVELSVREGTVPHAGMPKVPLHYLDVLDDTALLALLKKVRPDVVVNCVGVIKQRPDAQDPILIYPINAVFPHKLARSCAALGARMIHFSTDCVFTGHEGNYADDAPSDAQDYYGHSKFAGEVSKMENVITLRTSIIGHEVRSQFALIDWFLGTTDPVKGFKQAIFSGFPTVEVGHILADHVLPNDKAFGLYNMSADPISKYDLLCLVRDIYGKDIEIIANSDLKIDRSLNSFKFRETFEYQSVDWPTLIARMYATKPYS